jgi:hypothetical protein
LSEKKRENKNQHRKQNKKRWQQQKTTTTKQQQQHTKHQTSTPPFYVHDDFDSANGNSVPGERGNKERQTCKEEARQTFIRTVSSTRVLDLCLCVYSKTYSHFSCHYYVFTLFPSCGSLKKRRALCPNGKWLSAEATLKELGLDTLPKLKKLVNLGVQHIDAAVGLHSGAQGPFGQWIRFYFISKDGTKAIAPISLGNWSRLCLAASDLDEGKSECLDDKNITRLLIYSGQSIPVEFASETQQQMFLKDLVKDLFAFGMIVRPSDVKLPPKKPNTTRTGTEVGGIGDGDKKVKESSSSTTAPIIAPGIPTSQIAAGIPTFLQESTVCSGITKAVLQQSAKADQLHLGFQVFIQQACQNRFKLQHQDVASVAQKPVSRPPHFAGELDGWYLFDEEGAPVLRDSECSFKSPNSSPMCPSCKFHLGQNFYQTLRNLADKQSPESNSMTPNKRLSLVQKDRKLSEQSLEIRKFKQKIRRLESTVQAYEEKDQRRREVLYNSSLLLTRTAVPAINNTFMANGGPNGTESLPQTAQEYY